MPSSAPPSWFRTFSLSDPACIESGNANLTLITDDGVVDDSEAEFLKQRIQELELQIAQLQQTGASRSEIGATIAEATGSALTPLAPVIEPVTPTPATPIAVVQNNSGRASVTQSRPRKPFCPRRRLYPWLDGQTSMPPQCLVCHYWQTLAGGLAGLLALVLGIRLWRTRTALYRHHLSLALDDEVEPLFEAVDPALKGFRIPH